MPARAYNRACNPTVEMHATATWAVSSGHGAARFRWCTRGCATRGERWGYHMSANLRFLLAVGLLGGAAHAEQRRAAPPTPSYVGTWSVDAGNCTFGQEQEGAPLRLEANRLDQHEAHCEFLSVRSDGTAQWTARATCTVEGNREKRRLALRVDAGRLTVNWGDGVSTTYRTCSSR